MNATIEKIIRDINFTMTMEDMPMTVQDEERLRDCMTGKSDIYEVLRQTIAKHTRLELP
jgi:hypothetical protein